ncbi:hypothetical protein ACFZCP_41980 [Streptomyces sp. NPDC007971]|uniref:hypothetical protein n=1 Tax=Streptomyces sp. NPDC007971 TaxID=3364799 RepID=UPI0036F1752D
MAWARPGWSLGAAAIGLAALSLGGVVRVVAQSSFQQALTPDRLLGRMSATARFVSWGGIPLGGVLGGVSGSAFGAPATLWIGAVGMTASFLPNFLSPLRTMRTVPEAEDPEGVGGRAGSAASRPDSPRPGAVRRSSAQGASRRDA